MSIFDFISALAQTVWTCFNGIIIALLENIDSFIEIKKVLDNFSTENIIALCLGVPTFLVSILLFAIKRSMKKYK